MVADLQGAEAAAEAFPDGIGLTADVADEAGVESLVAEVAERCGSIDILVNNAGLYASLGCGLHRDPARRVAQGDGRQRRVDVPDVPGRRAGDAARRRGRIVNISSGTPFRGVPFLLHYVTSKGAIVAFTRALAKEIGKDGVLVNCVAPGFTMSAGVEAHPEVVEKLRDVSVSARTLQRDQVPEDVVGAVVYLAGPGSSFVTGQTIVIDGGQTSTRKGEQAPWSRSG